MPKLGPAAGSSRKFESKPQVPAALAFGESLTMFGLSHSAPFWSDPAPRWLVTNGETTVGPVPTELLLRGYLGGRIPDHCHVRQEGWRAWRPLGGIREIGSIKRRREPEPAGAPNNLGEAVSRLPYTGDAGELLAAALQLAAQALAADAGLVHRYRAPLGLPVTSAVFGVPPDRLGQVLPECDPAYRRARKGLSLVGGPYHGLAERLLAERLQHDRPMLSVAMTPVVVSGKLVALLELGRTDHPFRADDTADLSQFAAHVARRFA
jgi:GAF domain-containing protein